MRHTVSDATWTGRHFARVPLVEPLEMRLCLAVQNGGFEAFPDFAGFERVGNNSIRGGNFYVPVPEGEVQGVLSNAAPAGGASAPVSAGALEAFLGLPAGALGALGAGPAIEGSAIKQSFTGSAGEEVSFRFNLLTNEGVGGPHDFAFFTLLPASPPVTGTDGARLLAQVSQARPISPQNVSSGFRSETGYAAHAFTLPADGTYTLGFGVVDADDDRGDTALLLDLVAQSAPPPRVTSAVFQFTPPHGLRLDFSKDVSASLAKEDLVLENLTAGSQVDPSFLSLQHHPQNGATFAFPGFAGGALPSGNYRATLPAASVTDSAGTPLPRDFVLEFFVLAGDVNRDRSVNGTDFAILAGNFGRTGMTYGQGDLNGDGSVNGSDFALLAGNFGKSLAAPSPPPPAPVSASVARTARSQPARRAGTPRKAAAPVPRRRVPPLVTRRSGASHLTVTRLWSFLQPF